MKDDHFMFMVNEAIYHALEARCEVGGGDAGCGVICVSWSSRNLARASSYIRRVIKQIVYDFYNKTNMWMLHTFASKRPGAVSRLANMQRSSSPRAIGCIAKRPSCIAKTLIANVLWAQQESHCDRQALYDKTTRRKQIIKEWGIPGIQRAPKRATPDRSTPRVARPSPAASNSAR